jgi:beta-mannosidase
MARGFFAPVTVAAVPGADGIALVGINDRLDPVELSVTAYATAMDGTAREIGRGAARVSEVAERLMVVPEGALGPQEVLTFGWEGSDGTHAGDIFAPRPWKAFDLPDPRLAFEVAQEAGVFELSVTARAMAFFVTAEADVPGRWSRNAVHLGPGAVSRLTFTPRKRGAEPRFLLRDLHSATVRRPS